MSVSPLQPLQKYHTRCPFCGLGVKTGFQFKRHRAACGPRLEVHPEPPPQYDVASDMSSSWYTVASGTSPTGLVCPPDAPIVTHFDALQDAPGLHQCSGWRPRVLIPQEDPGNKKWSRAAVCRRINRQVRAAISNFALNSKFEFDLP